MQGFDDDADGVASLKLGECCRVEMQEGTREQDVRGKD